MNRIPAQKMIFTLRAYALKVQTYNPNGNLGFKQISITQILTNNLK